MTAIKERPSSNGRLGSGKVKTGCFTCKARRVKCDETKPSCMKCTKGGRRCDGYRTTLALQQSEQDWQLEPRATSLTFISPERALASFASSEQETRSLHFYRHSTAASLSHTLDSTFWTEFILQVSDSEPAVRHALVAIGALNERLRLQPGDTSPIAAAPTHNRNLRLALSSYNKAIKCLTTRMKHGQSDLIALLTCILFICVEFLQDNIAEALTLVHQGCAIIRGQGGCADDKIDSSKSPSQQLLIRHQVMPIFTRLTLLSAVCGRPARLKISDDAEVEQMLNFLDYKGARACLYLLMDQGHGIVRKADAWKGVPGPLVSTSGTIDIEDLRLEQAKHLMRLEQWHERFAGLQAELTTTASTRLIQAVSKLSMYFNTTLIWSRTCLDKSQTAYDAHLSRFRKIVEGAELFINLSEDQSQDQILFTFEMGLCPPLYFTATKCRDPALRRQAISMIRRAPRKEGTWDREELVYVAGNVVRMEERREFDAVDDIDDTVWPIEAARLHDVHFDREGTQPGQRKAVVRYISKPDGLEGLWHTSEEHFDV